MSIVEKMARVIDPESWSVMDGYLAETECKYRGKNAAWPQDQFKHKKSLKIAHAAIAATGLTEAQLEGLENGTHYIIERPRVNEEARHISADGLVTEDGPDAVMRAAFTASLPKVGEPARLRTTLERCRTVLGNMAAENEGAIFNRWPIHHEPLRSDACGLLPVIDEALAMLAAKEG